MPYRPLKEYDEVERKGGEDWRFLTRKINNALSYLFDLAAGAISQVINSITKDENGKAQLVNDLTDVELAAQNKDLVYGYQKLEGMRGWKPDRAGYVGTKEVDEAALGDDKILVYDLATDKYVLEEKPTGGGDNGGKGFLLLPYLLWRSVLGSVFTGYIDVQLQVATTPDFTGTLTYDLDSGVIQTGWKGFSAASSSYIPWIGIGLPATDIMGIGYIGSLDFPAGSIFYMRWRVYAHGTSNFGEWIPGGTS